MTLSNYPPGAENDPRAPWNQVEEDAEPIEGEECEVCWWPADECKCEPKDEHDEFCGVNRVIRRSCDCWYDS